jgi:hypothetical protein
MKAYDLLEHLRRQKVSVSADGHELLVVGPSAVLTDAVVEALRTEKETVLGLLRRAPACLGCVARNLDEYRDAFRREHDAYVCPRCGDPVLLEEVGNGKRYVDWFGRPHRELCQGRNNGGLG